MFAILSISTRSCLSSNPEPLLSVLREMTLNILFRKRRVKRCSTTSNKLIVFNLHFPSDCNTRQSLGVDINWLLDSVEA